MPSLTTKVELLFGGRCKRAPQGVHFAPGRLVLLGEHLDHQGGHVLAAPLPEGVACAWGVRPDSRVVVWSMNARQKDSFHQSGIFKSGRSWADLARGAYAHVAADGRRMPGIDLMVLGDLPVGQGLASSAAYVVVLLRSLYDAIGAYRSRHELAADVPAIEREWIGVNCGNMDPYVVATAKPGQVLHLDCRELDHEVLHVAEGYELVAEDTGIERRLQDTPYNERRAELERALTAIRAVRPDVRSLCELAPESLPTLAARLEPTALQRVSHVVSETARVVAGAEALASGDMETLGALMNAGHTSLVEDFDSSLPEIDRLADLARARPHVLGVRLNGAGWGGRLAILQRQPGPKGS
jgi:galactokinase